ncbi:hypothetical protein SAMN05518865_108229 [Duganella sp. CF458]|uniref:hypothetical protein n=1 Tax=Duganella sp. CF458 TaxID=1884368 RepID=UPI0008E802B7|nr:hypothetical protein [Duganella sp. CF458]SFG12632.1 hypothetical protein SAMN05518865_108229 [Duganella sp. CF458]
MSKAETEIAALKKCQKSLLQGQAELRATMERGFIEQRTEMAALRSSMDAGFADHRNAMEAGFTELRRALERASSEERAARAESVKELRQEMQRGFRWTFSALLSILALVLGIIARLAGAF